MAYFPHAFQKVLVGTNGLKSSSTSEHVVTLESHPGKVSVIDAKTNAIQDLTAAPATKLFYLAQGSFHTSDKIGPFHGGYKESVKTKGINPKFVSKFYYVAPAAPVNQIITVGEDDYCTIPCEKTVRLRLDVKGSPALRFLTHNVYKTLDSYTGCCDSSNTPVGVETVFEAWKAEIAADPILSKFISAAVLYITKNAQGVVTGTSTTKTSAWIALPAAEKAAKLQLTGAYVDTKFGDCSFSPMDHVELEPIQIYASALEDNGDPCASNCFSVAQVQAAAQGKGFGETVLRELILSKRYEQEPFQTDARLREVLDDTTLGSISRTASYGAYYILHSVPRSSNPSGMMDADQYLIKVVVSAPDADFETFIDAALAAAGNSVALETL